MKAKVHKKEETSEGNNISKRNQGNFISRDLRKYRTAI
jgi:hypothetical protein